MLDGVPFKPIPQLNIVCHMGGLGDSVARMPAVNYILTHHQHIQHANLFVQDYFVPIAQELLSHHADRITVRGYTGMKEFINSTSYPGVMCDYVHHTTMRTHLTDHAFHSLADEGAATEYSKRYLKFKWAHKVKQSRQVVITTGFTSATREFNPTVINALSAWCNERSIKPIFLGKKQSVFHEANKKHTEANFRTEVDYSAGEDLRDSTSLLTAANIMARSLAVVGIDNGLLHLAACTDTPVVFGLTTLKPEHRIPYGAHVYPVLPDEGRVPCRFCQSNMGFVYNFDLRNCYTNTYKCVSEQQPADFINALRKALCL